MRGRILPLLPGAIPAAGEIILLSHMNSRAMALPHPASAHANDAWAHAAQLHVLMQNLVRVDNVHSGGAHSFYGLLSFASTWIPHDWRDTMAPYGLMDGYVSYQRCTPNSPPGTTTEPPCCHCQNFLQILLLKEFSSFSLFSAVEGRYLTASRAVLFQDRFECTPVLYIHQTPVSISDIETPYFVVKRVISRLPFVSHRTTICALFSVRVPHSLTPS